VSHVAATVRSRLVLAVMAGAVVLAVLVLAAFVLVGALAGAAPGTSGDYGALY
jgi:hypothetical protein